MLDEKFDLEQTSSNIIQHDFFLLFYFFLNFGGSQMHPTSKISVLDEMLDAFVPALNYKEAVHKLSNDAHPVLNWRKVLDVSRIES